MDDPRDVDSSVWSPESVVLVVVVLVSEMVFVDSVRGGKVLGFDSRLVVEGSGGMWETTMVGIEFTRSGSGAESTTEGEEGTELLLELLC